MASRSVADFTDPYVKTLTPPPLCGEGVCDICHGSPNAGFSRCYSCHQTTQQVSRPLSLVVPISLYEIPGQLHHVLRNYKDGYDDAQRYELQLRVAALLLRFLSEHGEHVARTAGEPWEIITSVPSTVPRAGGHPLESTIGLARQLMEQYEPLLERHDGVLGHNQASDTAYRVTGDVAGANVLLVDDTFTSGARIQSAASALSLAGAKVIAAVPIGRVINPDYNESTREFWDAVRRRPFTFDLCCLDREAGDELADVPGLAGVE
jgi:predicted amidophosphoribosyltransferase